MGCKGSWVRIPLARLAGSCSLSTAWLVCFTGFEPTTPSGSDAVERRPCCRAETSARETAERKPLRGKLRSGQQGRVESRLPDWLSHARFIGCMARFVRLKGIDGDQIPGKSDYFSRRDEERMIICACKGRGGLWYTRRRVTEVCHASTSRIRIRCTLLSCRWSRGRRSY